MGYPVIAPEEIADKKIDMVIIGSRASADAIIKNLKQIAPGCEYLNIYEELALRGIKIDYNFFSEQNIYTDLYRLRLRYENAKEDDRQGVLKEIIASYFSIRDFYYAEKYSQIYIHNRYQDYEKLKSMLHEIRALKNELIQINREKKGNVLVHLIDSLRAVDVFENSPVQSGFKMFQAYGEHSVSFTNAYSTGPTTYESMMGMIKEKLSFEEDVYDNNFMFQFDEFRLLSEMKKENKKIIFYVAKDYLIMEESPEIVRKEQLHMSEKLWSAACDIAENDKNIFGFLYYPWELHFPLLCGYLRNEPKIMHFSDVGIEDMSDFITDQFEDCKRYVDTQFDYYREMLGANTIHVFTGDHSQPVYSEEHKEYPFFMYYNNPDRVSHVAFFISGNDYKRTEINQVVSMLDFNEILKNVVCDKNMQIPERELVQYQYYNIQNKKMREAAEKNGFWDYTEGIRCFLSDRYLYVVTATGKEEIYEKTCGEYMITESREAGAFADMVKEKYDTSFPGFWTIRYREV